MLFRRILTFGLLLLGLGLAPLTVTLSAEEPDPAVADDFELEELGRIQVESIYSASKYEQKVTKAPTSASIITRDEIERFGHRNVAEVIRSVRGMTVSNDRNYWYLGMRGFLRPGDYTTRMLVLIDGHRMNENIYDSGTLGADAYIDIDLVERIEVVRGPGSAIYGNNAFFGVINIVTRPGSHIAGGEISAEAGSLGTYKGRFTYGEKLTNGVQFTLSGSILSTEGNDELYYPEFGGSAQDLDGELTENLFGSVSWHGFTLQGNYWWRDKDVPTATYGSLFNDPQYHTVDRRSYIELRYETPVEAEIGVQAKIAFDDYRYDAETPYDHGIGTVVINKDHGSGKWITPELSVRKTFAERLTGIVGADARFNLEQHIRNYDDDPRAYVSDYNEPEHNTGIFAQGDLEVTPEINVVAGLRYDYYEDVGDSLNPRAGVIYNPGKSITVKLLYGEAFRAPNAYELLYNSLDRSSPGNLDPEEIRTYEIVLDQYILKNYRAGLSLYRFEVDSIITQVDEPLADLGYVFRNQSGLLGHGIETEFEARFDHGVLMRFSYSVQEAEDDNGNKISSSPQHLVKAGIIFPLIRERLFSGIEAQYTSSAITLQRNKTDDFMQINWTLSARDVLKGMDLSVGVYNMLDEEYAVPGSEDHLQDIIPQDGRTFRAKATYRF